MRILVVGLGSMGRRRIRNITALGGCEIAGFELDRERGARGTIGRPLAFTHHVGQYLPDWHPWEDYRTFYVSRRATGAAREIVLFELNWLSSLFGPVTAVTGMKAKLSSLEADIDDI